MVKAIEFFNEAKQNNEYPDIDELIENVDKLTVYNN